MGEALQETEARPDAARPAAPDRAHSTPDARPLLPRSRAAAGPRSLQFLQASAGNAAVARMLARPAPPRPVATTRPTPAGPPAPTVACTAEAPTQVSTEAPAEPEVEPTVEPTRADDTSTAAAAPPPADPSDSGNGTPAVQRKVAGADFPGAGLIVDAVRAIPGYHLMAQITGEDPISGDKVTTGRAEFVQTLLGFGPFAGAVGPVLQGMNALDEIFTLVQGRLGQHNLTMARIEHDIGAAWDEVHVANGIDANVAVVRRYLAAFLTDVRAFAASVVSDVLAAIRAAAVTFAKPLVQDPAIKPVWDLGTKVFHYDPLTGEAIHAPTEEILAGFLHLIGKDDALAQMRERGTLAKTAEWLDTQFATFTAIKGQATALFTDAWAAISPENLPHLLENLHSLAQRAFSLLGQVGSFATTVLSKVVSLIKDALLGMLSERAHQTKGFTAMTVMLGKDPFTSAPVPRTPTNLIRAFVTLLPNGDQVFEQLSQSGVIADAAGRIESEMVRLGVSWEMVSGTFHAIWDQLSLEDLLDPLGAFLRILNQFEEPLGRIVSFAATVLQVVIELILRLMNFPSELLGDIIAKAMAAIEDIKKDPIQFLTNIVQAMKQGVMGFLDKIGSYLLHGLTDWLFRGMRGMGIEPPKDLSLQSIITFVLQVLGVTEQKLWDQLTRKIGAEKVAKVRAAIDRLGQAWQFVKDVQERGIAAIWEFIQGKLSNLWDMILEKAKNWIMTEIIDKVTAKLLSMLDPTGIMAVVNSCIAFFNAIQSAIEYLREILQIIDKYVSTIASIARGDVAPGAKMLEDGLAQAVPVAIGFLANQVGLGNVPEKVAEILHGFQGVVDEAFTWLVDQAWSIGQSAIDALTGGPRQNPSSSAPPAGASIPGASMPWPETRTPVDMDGESHSLWVQSAGATHQIFIASTPVHLLSRSQSALNNPQCPAGARAPLQEIVTDLTKLEAEITENERLYRGPGTDTQPMGEKLLASPVIGLGPVNRDQFRQAVTNMVVMFRTRLEALGHQFHMKDLQDLGHRSKFVTGDSIGPPYRLAGVWRDLFYGHWDTALRESIKQKSLQEGTTYWRSRNPGEQIPPDLDVFYCKEGGHWVSSEGRTTGFDKSRWTLDHTEAVVTHWNKAGGGRSMVQDERTSWYNVPTNLEPMCQRCNQEKERTASWSVQPRFRGPADNPPDPRDAG